MLDKTWFFAAEWNNQTPDNVPETAIPFELDETNGIDLDSISGIPGKEGSQCLVWNDFTLQEECELTFSLAADWWYRVFCNGELVLDTLTNGAGHGCSIGFTVNPFTFKGHAGRNRIAIHIKRGSVSWKFIFLEAGYFAPAVETTVCVNTGMVLGNIKPMNAVNNGPIIEREDQTRGNSTLWRAAKIPFARNHDASFSYYGGHVVDVHVIFPDFSRDPDDPAAYDFAMTDQLCRETQDCGSRVFYRLGSRIEHHLRKYGTLVPPDFKKWAVVCEHIIRHLNEGWGNGLHLDIDYWEIWNEPDLDPDDSTNKRNWQGTEAQFHDFYEIAARHLKTCFPNLKIGGPALCGLTPWGTRFVQEMHRRHVPMDFLSFHAYTRNPGDIGALSVSARQLLDRCGYAGAELILDEWNYIRGWSAQFVDSIRTIIGLKGAAFTAAGMCSGQNSPLTMLMYYDARPCVFNGLFDFYTFAPLKGYYSFVAWAKLAELGRQVKAVTDDNNPGFYAVAASDGSQVGVLLVRFWEPDQLPPDQDVRVRIPGCNLLQAKLMMLDEKHDFTCIPVQIADGQISFKMPPNSLCFLSCRQQ